MPFRARYRVGKPALGSRLCAFVQRLLGPIPVDKWEPCFQDHGFKAPGEVMVVYEFGFPRVSSIVASSVEILKRQCRWIFGRCKQGTRIQPPRKGSSLMMVRTSCPTRQSSRPVSEVHVCFQAPLQDRRLFILLLFLLQIIANYQQQASRRSPAAWQVA